MKKIIALSLLFSVLLCSELQAQFKFNVQAGLNINQAHMSDFSNLNKGIAPLLSYSAGLNVSYEMNDRFALQSGLLLTQKAVRLDFSDEYYPIDGDITFKLNYIEIPLQGVFNIGKQFQVYGGPYFAFGIGGKQKSDYIFLSPTVVFMDNFEYSIKPTSDQAIPSSQPVDNDACPCGWRHTYNRLDYGINAGVGYRLGKMLIRAGYTLGLENVRIAQGETDTNREVYNRSMNLSVSYFLGK